MPAMADITIKKFDGVTNVTWSAKSPSAGNNVPAIWRSDSVGSSPGQRPELRLLSRDGGDGLTRKMRGTLWYPQLYTDTTTGLISIQNKAVFDGTWTLPNGMPDQDLKEFAAQGCNLMDSTLFISCLYNAFAPT